MTIPGMQPSEGQRRETETRLSLAERIESVKAGAIAALATGLAMGGMLLATIWLPPNLTQGTDSLMQVDASNWLLSWAIALISGFLFGITYRYVIRRDQNSHLGDGAVLAFGLVRGLAQIDQVPLQPDLWLLPIFTVLKSVVLFAIARLILDFGMKQGWVKAFK